MKNCKMILMAASMLLLSGCAYWGFHGKSVKRFPEFHEGITEDVECLSCHHPENAKDEQAPPTPHPGFTGCLKCHNDNI